MMARMTASGLERARRALHQGDAEALLGERECAWLDVKERIYPLDKPKGAEELAKDVAAFANTPHGGLLVVGFATRKEHGEEIVDVLHPVPRTLVKLDQYRQVIATRVLPALRDLTVDWIDRGNGTGVLVIDIPAQPRSSQLFAVPAPTGTAEVSKIAVGVPVRRGDGTTWLRPHEIQHFIGLGYANSGDGADKLAAALAAIQAPREEEPKYTVGGGEPGWTEPFQQAVSDLAGHGVTLGEPVSLASASGPGVAQHFRAPGQQTGWVLCARPGRRPVAVAGEIWQALREQGSGAPDGDALAALGLPVGDADTTRVVGQDATEVALSGGHWGPGRLLRAAGRGWRWEPDPVVSTETSAVTRNWTGGPNPPQLRARVLAVLPLAGADTAKISPDRLDAVLPRLPFSALAAITTALSRGRVFAGSWAPGRNGNASDRLSYACEITAPDGQLALSAEVMMTLPPASRGFAVVTCAEVRVENFDAWSRVLDDPAADLRWSVDDLVEFFVAAWDTATELLPQLIDGAEDGSPASPRWAGVPRVELSIGTESRHDQQAGEQLVLANVFDLEPFGPSDRRDQLTELFVAVHSAPGLDADSRRRLVRSVLVEMAHRYGFMQVRDRTF